MQDVQIHQIVEQVLSRLNSGSHQASIPSSSVGSVEPLGVFPTVDGAVEAARSAFLQWRDVPLEKRKSIVQEIRSLLNSQVDQLARMAVEETGLGRVSDKVLKNQLVIHKTPGPEYLQPEAFSGDHGLTIEEYAPFGVIASITPCTNPTETIINNGIGMISGGNTVVFHPHPSAQRVSSLTIHLINLAVTRAGGPRNIVTAVSQPTIDSTQYLMKHKGANLLVVTGGPAVVKAALQSGKRVIAAGPGNPPVLVDETADLERAARDIVAGASFDNNIVCIVEKELFVVNSVTEQLKKIMLKHGAYEINSFQAKRLQKVILDEQGHVNKKWVGKDARLILDQIGIKVGNDVRLITTEVDASHPFVTHELLMPVLPLVRVKDAFEGIQRSIEAENGRRHTAVVHSRNIQVLHEFATRMDCSIVIKNGPSFAGLGEGGEGHTSFTIAGPTGEGLTTVKTFTRRRRCTLKEYFRIV